MVFGTHVIDQTRSNDLYKTRRKELVGRIKEQFPEKKDGVVVIFAGFEQPGRRFVQDSSFFYLSGINEPGVVLAIDMDGFSTLYVPAFAQGSRCQWTGVELTDSEGPLFDHIDEIKELGRVEKGITLCGYPIEDEYKGLLELISQQIKKDGFIFTLCPRNSNSYCWQRLVLERIKTLKSELGNVLFDVSSIVEQMRRRKDLFEIEQIYKAAEVTILAHEAAAQAIAPDVNEREVRASLEYIITGSFSEKAFPTIVASGKNSTVLHYSENNLLMKSGGLVVVDAGAEFNHYCADITRTYPVSGCFTDRQRKIYEIVLDTQDYIAAIAKPGYWLCNNECPEKSLNHLAKEFIQDKGFGDNIVHGIGHFLGLDVHDVGDVNKPLQENDVITIEPGIYIPEEGIGIRIEDDYWIAKDGAICISDGLPKKPDEVQLLVRQNFSEDEEMCRQVDYGFLEDETDA